jgi:hypothetical protein
VPGNWSDLMSDKLQEALIKRAEQARRLAPGGSSPTVKEGSRPANSTSEPSLTVGLLPPCDGST